MPSKKLTEKSPKEIFVCLCQKHKLNYEFKEFHQDRMRVFHCTLTITSKNDAIQSLNFSVEGCGIRKKNAEHHACLLMLNKLAVSAKLNVKVPDRVKLPKVIQSSTNSSSNKLHPVSRLSQIAQAKKVELPKFELKNLFSDGLMYVVTCTMMDHTTTAKSSSRKQAKLMASHSMLNKLGFISQSTEHCKEATDETLSVIDELPEPAISDIDN